MRGTPNLAKTADKQLGIIPAYAGNTCRRLPHIRLPWDHPRVCGEHIPKDNTRPVYTGSSPRMRGTRPFSGGYSRFFGIIPAYAGNTRYVRAMMVTLLGSSPRMRGTPNIRPLAGKGDGIIPAYAGNTSSAAPRGFSNRDHPRVCGEHQCRQCNRQKNPGSSPRMRGTPAGYAHHFHAKGIIPAYAGNTMTSYAPAPSLRDHPRVCGEH